MSPEISAVAQLLLRWFHIFFGVVWLGHLCFFNFVNAPFQATLEKELKPRVNPPLLLRALYWFRWGAVFTLLTGWVLFGLLYWPSGAALLPPGGGSPLAGSGCRWGPFSARSCSSTSGCCSGRRKRRSWAALMPGWMHGVFLILVLGGVHGIWKHAQKAGGSL